MTIAPVTFAPVTIESERLFQVLTVFPERLLPVKATCQSTGPLSTRYITDTSHVESKNTNNIKIIIQFKNFFWLMLTLNISNKNYSDSALYILACAILVIGTVHNKPINKHKNHKTFMNPNNNI